MRCFIVPPYLLERIAHFGDESADDERLAVLAEAARRSLRYDAPLRQRRVSQPPDPLPTLLAPDPRIHHPHRTIFDADNTETLPGRMVRQEGEASGSDIAVTEAYDGLGDTHALFLDAFHHASIDGRNQHLDATVHYGQRYANAFWDGDRMVFGDGDGEIFGRFTTSLSVIGHELAHGVIGHSAGLVYQAQSGALAESIADVFGALVEQRAAGQSVAEASWLIGAGLFTHRVAGKALRSMLAPGTAYDDAILGKDPQPDHMDGYVSTDDDNGGVHVNSGIPNRAFTLFATALGGKAWERSGLVWFDALTRGIPRDCDFATFADATLTAGAARFGGTSGEVDQLRDAWRTVGIIQAGRRS
jgi:Zn-dependent metalloprotease